MNDILIRVEREADIQNIEYVIQAAFEHMELSDQTEHKLVHRLRKSDAFIPNLSLVAELDGQLIGHILITHVTIKSNDGEYGSLSVAPVSVHPDFQRQGIGSQLIKEAHNKARSLGFGSIMLVGHPEYYPRFGYRKASDFDVSFPFDAPDEACMAFELTDNALKGVCGIVVYPKAFFE